MKKVLLALVALMMLNSAVAQTVIGDATLPNNKTYESHELILNGAGLREKLWFDLYAAGLFLKEKNTDADAVVAADQPMAIHLVILSGMLSKKKMIGAFRDGFENTNDKATVQKLQSKIDKYVSFISEEISVSDRYDIIYTTEKGNELYKNGKLLGAIEGLEFKKALFNIWLSKEPVDDDLKDSMLGN
ncbi:chalcone isomerase family protein [Aquimarina agarilytica]|uniref:chalcone isomerase family protein n=1 Tax=Aquimarina agarilytica TaxID=1087449 RepID=UPI000288548F|nr:chalcone isomerase family protein [Aquimarina agarilytica]